jgi:hypothetical protein
MNRFPHLAILGALCLSTAALSLGGCATKAPPSRLKHFESQHQAGTTDAAVIYVEPWDVVAPALSPDFQLNEDKALERVVPTTTAELNRFLDALSVKFGLGLPSSSVASTETKSQKTGEAPTSQLDTTRKTEPGKAPEIPKNAYDQDYRAGKLPGTAVLSKDIAQEPLLHYKAALALYQEVKMLNRYVLGAARRGNYEPYLVRMQLTLMPFARNSPYDVYFNISFFVSPDATTSGSFPIPKKEPASQEDLPLLPVVIPLVVTDALEGSLTSTTTDIIRQLALSLGGTVGNVGVAFGSESLRDDLRSITGRDLNSVLTIGRLGDNGVKVRLGAVKSPIEPGAYVMVPRTHNVTVLLMVPKTTGAPPTSVRVAARSFFYDAMTGQALPMVKGGLREELMSLMNLYIPSPILNPPFKVPDDCPRPQFDDQGAQRSDKRGPEVGLQTLALYLIERSQEDDIKCFTKAMRQHTRLNDSDFLWNDITALSNSFGYAATRFTLPKSPTTQAPPSQLAFLTDDGVTSATVSIHGGSGLVPDRINAALVVRDLGDDSVVAEVPSSDRATFANGTLRIFFPSLEKSGITKDGALVKGKVAELRLWQRPDIWSSASGDFEISPCSASAPKACGTYPVRIEPAPEKPKPGFKFQTAVSTLPIKEGQTTQVSVYVTFDGAKVVTVETKDGRLRSGYLPDKNGRPGKLLESAGGIVQFAAGIGPAKPRREVLLLIDDLVAGGTLTLTAKGVGADGKSSGSSTANIALKAIPAGEAK